MTQWLSELPELAAEFDSSRNHPLTPGQVTSGSKKSLWWLCSLGHGWKTSAAHRKLGTGCPFCARKKVLSGFNDLATTNPDLVAEWGIAKNGALTPENVLAGTSKKVWWICSLRHEWMASVSGRTTGKKGCPVCAGRLVIPGVNDLATTHPHIAIDWHPSQNGDLTPRDVVAGTNKRVWWLCALGHEWQTSGHARVGGSGCPVCAGQRVLAGYNDLATRHPELAKQWHPSNNIDLTPDQVMPGTHKKVWWRCHFGHEWFGSIANRAVNGRGCPVCAGREVVPGTNDLATTHPEVAAEWHPSKNGDLNPQQVVGGTPQRIWWLCELGHVWQARASHRIKGVGCPVCTGRVVVKGFNDLATTHPRIAAEWHPLRNGALTPEDVVAGTNKKIWWQCDQNHEWQAKGNLRVVGTGCPDCAEYGFKPQKPAVVYFLQHTGLAARKVGITNSENKGDRVASFRSSGWQVISEWPMRGDRARVIERLVFDWIRSDLGLTQYLLRKQMGRKGGETETFTLEGPSNQEVIEYIERCIQEIKSVK